MRPLTQEECDLLFDIKNEFYNRYQQLAQEMRNRVPEELWPYVDDAIMESSHL